MDLETDYRMNEMNVSVLEVPTWFMNVCNVCPLYILTVRCNIDNNTLIFQYFVEVAADSS